MDSPCCSCKLTRVRSGQAVLELFEADCERQRLVDEARAAKAREAEQQAKLLTFQRRQQ